jgi:dTDP-4-amino-4,6-dideoxygalactose transaminase
MVSAAPFRVQLLCPSEPVRDSLLSHLARHRIYAPVHWRQDRTAFWSGDEEAAALADRMLTVPVDHRCTPADVHRVADALHEFAQIRALSEPTGG